MFSSASLFKNVARLSLVILFFLLSAGIGLAKEEPFVFTRNLQLGDRGTDVLKLQQILNASADTSVAISGAGSKGYETEYFGARTKIALARFQEKYKAEMLSPLGLSRGTGFVGALTRKKLNSVVVTDLLLSVDPTNPSPLYPSPTLPLFTPIEKDSTALYLSLALRSAPAGLHLVKLSKVFGPVGTTIALYGAGFGTEEVTLHFGSTYTLRVKPESNNRITFTVPTDLSVGKYTLWVESAKNVSNKNLFFIVVRPGAVPPTIDRVLPTHPAPGETVTIYGNGFDQKNEVLTLYYSFPGVASSDGKSFSFVLDYEYFSKLQELKDKGKKVGDLDVPVVFHVVNGNGISEKPGTFFLKIRKKE